MSKLSNKAFAIMAMCEETKKPFGITVDPRQGCYAFTWAFKINPDQAKREGYDKTHVRGAVMYDEDLTVVLIVVRSNSTSVTGVRKSFVIMGRK